MQTPLFYIQGKMKGNTQYKIDIFRLGLGVHELGFGFDESIFENVEDGVIESAHGQCTVMLDKKDTLLSIDFKIKGVIGLICDRSLKPFDYPVEIEENLIVKYGPEPDDSRDGLLVIPYTQKSINIEPNIYECLALAVPMKKLHPDFQDENDDEIILTYTSGDENTDGKKGEDRIDPRWDALKSIKVSRI